MLTLTSVSSTSPLQLLESGIAHITRTPADPDSFSEGRITAFEGLKREISSKFNGQKGFTTATDTGCMQSSSRRAILAGIAGAGAVSPALSGCLQRSGPAGSETPGDESAVVSTYKYDAERSGVLATPPPGEDADVEWSIEPDVAEAMTMLWPVVTDETLYAGIGTWGSSGGVLALDTASGDERWRTESVGWPTLADETLYIGGDVITAHSADDGTEQWSFDSPEGATAPAIVDGRMYSNRSGTAFALETSDGSDIWTHEHGASRSSSVTVADGTVYVGQASPPDSGPRGVVALDASDGTELWQRQLTSVNVTPAVRDGIVYVPTNDGTMTALDAGDGTVRWQNAPEGHTPKSPWSPSVTEGRVFTRTEETVYALDRETGETVWQQPAGETWISALPVVGDRIAVPGAGTVAMRRVSDGSLEYELSIGGDGHVSGMVIREGRMYLGSLASGAFSIHAFGE